jgi:hypothetical protein
MGLKEVMDETKKQIEEAEKIARDGEAKAQEEIDAENKAIEDSKTEKKEEVKKEVKDEVKDEKESEVKAEEDKPKKTNADFARERKERISEAQRLREELAAANAKIAAMTQPQKEEKKEDLEPNKEEDPTAWADWRTKQAEKKAEAAKELASKAIESIEKQERVKAGEKLVQDAQNELLGYEDQFKKDHADYEDVKKYYVNTLAFSIKSLNPKITNDALVKAVNNQILLNASQFYNDGYANPVEALYESAKELGYRPPKEEKEVEEKKPDLSKVAKNRERNAGMAGAGGSGGKSELTKRYAATEMTSQEWARLPVAERERLMRGE